MVEIDALLIALFHALAFAFVVLWTAVFRRASEGPTDDHVLYAAPEKPSRGRRAASGGRSREARRAKAARLLFRDRTTAALILDWLRGMAVPPTDREDLRQMILMRAWQRFSTYNPDRGRPRRWLRKLAARLVRSWKQLSPEQREEPR